MASIPQDLPTIVPEDETFTDPGYDSDSTAASYATSLASEIRRGVEENGRVYASFGKHEAQLPQDDEGKNRNDLQHCKFRLLLGDKLHLAPIAENPTKVLDLGTGTGIWAIEMADSYPGASVIGVDTAPMQPTWVPPNLQFELLDIEEDDWLVGRDFDLIFCRELLLAIRDWPKLIKQAYDRLKPGGYLELSMTVPRVHCQDGSLDLNNSMWVKASDMLFDMAEKMGMSIDATARWKEQFIDIGFEDVVENLFLIPVGGWPKDERLKNIGRLELVNIGSGVSTLMLRGFVNFLEVHRRSILCWERERGRSSRIGGIIAMFFCKFRGF